MQSTIKKLPKSEVEMGIEVPAEEFSHFIEQATLNLGRDLEIKGFRKGKVPKEIIEKQIGQEKILVEAAELAIKENYRKAVLENKIEAIFQPKIEIRKLAKGKDLVFLAKTAVLPEVKLPDYRKIASRIKRNKVVVEEKEIGDALSWLQKSRAKFTLKNQAAQKGDFVEIEYWSPQIGQQGRKDAFILGEGRFIPGLEEKLIGMRIGEEKERVSIPLPDKHPLEKTTKEITIKVKMNSVQNVELPEINDSFAKSLGKFENLEALKENIKQGINLEKEQAERLRVRNEILEKISEKTKVEIPNVLIEAEQKQMVGNIKKDILANLKIRKTEKEILDSFLPQVQKKVRDFLVLREIGKREFDPVRDSGNKEKISKEQISNGVDSREIKEYTEETEKIEKIFQLLEKICT